MLKFFAKDVIPVIEEAKSNQCKIIFEKANGVYMVSELGDYSKELNRRRYVAYAQGCNPTIDAAWLELATEEMGHGKCGTTLSPDDLIIQVIYTLQKDFIVLCFGFGFVIEVEP